MMLKGCIVLVLVCLGQGNPYERIHTYSEYNRQWKEQVPTESVHDVSHLAVNDEDCGGEKCRFFYYERKDPSVTAGQKAVLLVAGMHGNEYLGPHALLYGYEHLRGAHIVFFPLANPSGFQRNQRLTHPGKVDPNRDFPVDGNRECYRSNAAHVLDFLLRKYEFAMTIVLHDGSEQIGFNWGTHTHMKQSRTPDYPIQKDIAEMMRRAGGSNSQLGIKQLAVGTMDEVIYPARGSLDDWLYAVGRHPEVVTNCTSFKYAPYPTDMASQIVFLIEMGPHQSQLLGSSEAIDKLQDLDRSDDGYVSRGIRMLRQALLVIQPTLEFHWRPKEVEITVRGCPSAVVTFLKVSEIHNSYTNYARQILKTQFPVQVTDNQYSPHVRPVVFPYNQMPSDLSNSQLQISGNFECGTQWQGKGNSSFAKKRSFKIDLLIKSQEIIHEKDARQVDWHKVTYPKTNKMQQTNREFDYQKLAIYGIVAICILVLMSAIFAVLQCLLKPNVLRHGQKFENTENVEEVGMNNQVEVATSGNISGQL